MNFDIQQLTKPISSVTVKRSLTPRRRAREYALQGVYQWLVIKAAGGFADYATIAKQLGEDPGFSSNVGCSASEWLRALRILDSLLC